MTDFILKLLGARLESAGDIAGVRLMFHGGMGMGWFVLGVLVLGGLAWWLYQQSPVSLTPLRRRILTALRIIFLTLLLLLLLRPVLSFTVEGSVRRSLLLLVDNSASMQIKDPRVHADDVKRVALARNVLDPAKGLGQAVEQARLGGLDNLARLDIVKSVLRNERLDLLPRLDQEFDLVPFSFAQTVNALPRGKGDEVEGDEKKETTETKKRRKKASVKSFEWVDRLDGKGTLTALGDAMREVVQRKRGQPLSGVLIVTDGASNSGLSPLEAAATAKQEGVPLYIYGVGITSPRDIIVAGIYAPDISFVKDEVRVNVRVRSQGLAGETARLVLKLGTEKIAEEEIRFAGDAEQLVALKFTPERTGDFELEASIEPRADETVKDNNSRTQRLRVIDKKIKVLLVEQAPRWEYRYLQAMLMRDRRIEVKVVLFEGDPSISRGEGTPYLEGFPTRKDDLFKYDLILFGDVDPKSLSTANMEALADFVSKFGGAFVMVAGKQFSPNAYRRTPIERMLPVEFEAGTGAGSVAETVADKPIRLQLTAAGKSSTMMKLAEKDEENVNFWKNLPPIFWDARVTRAKPGAEVLLVDPDPVKETRFGKMPVMALQQYGLGQVLYIGTDNTWRWRKNTGDSYHTAFWGQISQRMAVQRLLGASKRTQLTSERQNYVTGDRVNIYARLYSVGFDPVTDPFVRGFYGLRSGTVGEQSELQLRPVPDQPGVYRGEFIAPAPGLYHLHVDQDPEMLLDFSVTEPRFELGETAMNEPLLREMAAVSGGAFFREEDLFKLPDTIKKKTDRVRSPLEVELWSSPLYFLLLIGVVTAEWILRKLSHLK